MLVTFGQTMWSFRNHIGSIWARKSQTEICIKPLHIGCYALADFEWHLLNSV